MKEIKKELYYRVASLQKKDTKLSNECVTRALINIRTEMNLRVASFLDYLLF